LFFVISNLEFQISNSRSHGEIIEAKGDNLFVQCGNETVLKIAEIQPEGKRRMPVRDYVNGVQPTPGVSFG